MLGEIDVRLIVVFLVIVVFQNGIAVTPKCLHLIRDRDNLCMVTTTSAFVQFFSQSRTQLAPTIDMNIHRWDWDWEWEWEFV